MEERMYRAQILLRPEQRRRLEEIARREGRSISAVTRRVIDLGLQAMEGEANVWEKRARLLAELRARREKQPFEYGGDLVNEARKERDDEMERIWRGNT
jgi:predicted DNA-binding protein